MSVQSTETRLIGTGAALLPRVNLLPPEIAEKRAFQRVQIGLGAAVLAAVGVVGLLYMSAANGVTSAQGELDTATSQGVTLQAEVAKYATVTQVYAAADAAQAQLTQALGDEIRYSQLLNDLSLSIPSNVWIKSLSYSGPAAPTAGTAAANAAAASPSLGVFTVNGVGFSHDDVAVWLESIAGLKTYETPYFSNSTETLLGKKTTVTFASTANLTPKALSGRYTKPAGD